MADILVEVTVTSKKDGSILSEKFPIDEGLFKAIQSLPVEEERIKFFTEEYKQWKHEDNLRTLHDGGSLDAEDELLEFAHDITDDSPTPKEYCLRKEQNDFLSDAIKHLSKKQRFVIIQLFFEDKTQEEVAAMMNLDQPAISQMLQRALAKLRKQLEGKI